MKVTLLSLLTGVVSATAIQQIDGYHAIAKRGLDGEFHVDSERRSLTDSTEHASFHLYKRGRPFRTIKEQEADEERERQQAAANPQQQPPPLGGQVVPGPPPAGQAPGPAPGPAPGQGQGRGQGSPGAMRPLAPGTYTTATGPVMPPLTFGSMPHNIAGGGGGGSSSSPGASPLHTLFPDLRPAFGPHNPYVSLNDRLDAEFPELAGSPNTRARASYDARQRSGSPRSPVATGPGSHGLRASPRSGGQPGTRRGSSPGSPGARVGSVRDHTPFVPSAPTFGSGPAGAFSHVPASANPQAAAFLPQGGPSARGSPPSGAGPSRPGRNGSGVGPGPGPGPGAGGRGARTGQPIVPPLPVAGQGQGSTPPSAPDGRRPSRDRSPGSDRRARSQGPAPGPSRQDSPRRRGG